MKRKKESYFWTSYSDLMTSLFFIMLTLFILTVALLNKRMQATVDELTQIKQIENSTKELDQSGRFDYRPEYKKYVLNTDVHFDTAKYELKNLHGDLNELRDAGREIQQFLKKHDQYSYLVIIEGQASRNSVAWTDSNYHYSFQRAYTLMKFWKDQCQIDFGNNCEIQITGSGDGRYNFGYAKDEERFRELDALLMRERGRDEGKNQRFIIHIIPKNIIEDKKKDKQNK